MKLSVPYNLLNKKPQILLSHQIFAVKAVVLNANREKDAGEDGGDEGVDVVVVLFF